MSDFPEWVIRADKRARQKRSAEEHRQSWRERLQLSGWPATELDDVHWEVVKGHGVSEQIAAAAGLRSIRSEWMREVLPGHVSRQAPLPALGIPIAELGIQVVRSWLLRPDQPRLEKRGKRRKYENVTGEAWSPFYVLPADADRVLLSGAEVWITEGVFDALALESKGCAALGLTAGTWGWSSDGRPHNDWSKVNLRGRTVKIAFDADQIENPHVRLAAVRFERFLIVPTLGNVVAHVLATDDLDVYRHGPLRNDLLLPYAPVDNEPFELAREMINSLHNGTRHQLAVSLLDEMWQQDLPRSSRSMTQLAGIADVSQTSAWRFGRAVASGNVPPFAADGWQSWSNGWSSRILILDTGSLARWKEKALSRHCAECQEILPAGARMTRTYCSPRCRKRASRGRGPVAGQGTDHVTEDGY